MLKHFLYVTFYLTTSILFGQDLFINEFMASNDITIRDPDYNLASDWIEIYNASPNPINLYGYYLSDNPDQPGKWQIKSSIEIAPYNHLIFWADDFGNGYHTNFKLDRAGEFIGLYSPQLTVIDTLNYGIQETDISYGRYPDGGKNWFVYQKPSPGSANGADGSLDIASLPVFSIPAGRYAGQINLEISTDLDSAQIYYTKDGSEPDESSTLYSGYINIRFSTPIRAIVYKKNYLPSAVVTNTYLMNTTAELPVISLTTNPDNFFDDMIGIYVIGKNGIPGYCTSEPRNWNQDWERPVHVELFETDGQLAFSQDAGVKIAGGCSRLYPEKSLEIVARDKYGDDRFRYRLFRDKPIHEFKSFILRTSAQDWWRSMIRDGFLHTLVSQTMNLDYQAYRPAVVYLNGQYWGIHNIREKLNEHYLYYNRGIDPDNVDIVKISETGYAVDGNLEAYTHLMDFITQNDMSLKKNFEYISQILDIDSYIDYQIYEIYIANRDWPGNNVKFYRERTENARWRWWLYDLDMGFGGNSEARYYSNILDQATAEDGSGWPNPPWSTLMFRRLLENTEFKNEFIQRFAVYLSITYKPEYVVSVIDSIKEGIADEIPYHMERWPKSVSYAATWAELLDIIYEFAYLRPDYVVSHLRNKFNLNELVPVSIETVPAGAGMIKINNVVLKSTQETMHLFAGLPVRFKAQSLPGYRFIAWDYAEKDSSKDMIVIPYENTDIRAMFEADTTQNADIVINEINYNSAPLFDPEDWLELYNAGKSPTDLSGWYFSDDQDSNRYLFSDRTAIDPNDYLVLCRDTVQFKKYFPNVSKICGNFDFGLNPDGETLYLYNSAEAIIDSLTYRSIAPWPEEPDGSGATLALKHPALDNSLADNWRASERYGTPGELNDVYLIIAGEDNLTEETNFALRQNYPNPFNMSTQIQFYLPQQASIDFYIYDIQGQRIYDLTDRQYNMGWNTLLWAPIKEIASGIYFYTLRFENQIITRKFIYLK